MSHYSWFPESYHLLCLITIRQVPSVAECLVHKHWIRWLVCTAWNWDLNVTSDHGGEPINWRRLLWKNTIRSYVAFVSTYAQGRECTYPGELAKKLSRERKVQVEKLLCMSTWMLMKVRKERPRHQYYRVAKEEAVQKRTSGGRQDWEKQNHLPKL